MGDRIRYRSGGWHDRYFADPTDAKWMTWGRHFNYTGLDQGKVKAGRHAVIEETGVPQDSPVIVEIFLIQCPADPLGCSALHLTFDVTRMNRFANILRHRGAQNINLARIGIDFHVNHRRGEGRS